jgi:hypothetical protein
MTSIIDRLHSSCTGFGATPIQGPSTAPVSPLKESGPNDLWFVSAYGSASSGKAVIEKAFEHDIHWGAPTEKSDTGETLGTLTDYAFESSEKTGPAYGTKWQFPELKYGVAGSTKNVLAKNVIPPKLLGAIFQYYKFSSPTSGELVPISEKIPAAAAADEVAKVAVTFEQAPESGNTKKGYGVASFSDAVVLRLNASETTTEAKNEPCT